MEEFQSALGNVHLQPLHYHPKSPLQAWNAADELALAHFAELNLSEPRILLVNDQQGALGTILQKWQPTHWNDSYSSKLALESNLKRNHLSLQADQWIPAHTLLKETHNKPFDVVIIKVPKSLAFLHYQLQQIRSVCAQNTVIIGAAMIKHLSANMIQTFETEIGPTHTSLAKKKARLILSKPETDKDCPASAQSKKVTEAYTYPLVDTGIQLYNYSNVFSQQKLDIGTRFLLENFPDTNNANTILDLGCGNGALGLFAAKQTPHAEIIFTDNSYLALESARLSFEKSGLNNRVHVFPSDALDPKDLPEQAPQQVDLILCNPPFHQGNNIEAQTAQRMFSNAKRLLKKNGKLVVVGNRHLNYHQSLKRHFKKVSLLASNRKFVILEAQLY